MWTAIVFVTILVVLGTLWVKISKMVSRARRIRRVLRRRKRHYKIKETAFIAACLLLFVSLPLSAYLDETNNVFDFSLLARAVDDATEPSRGVVRPVQASETSAEMAPIKPTNGAGAMSCPVGRGLVLLRRAITPVDPNQIPHMIAGAFETASEILLECQDDEEEGITSCEGYRNYKFDFYTSVALREIGASEEVLPCEPYDHFKAERMFRSYIVFHENGAKWKWSQ
jgi:hypothetical protein